MNKTIFKFEYPESLIKEYKFWVVMIRPEQVTLGSLIIFYKDDIENLSEIEIEGYKELKIVISDIEYCLKKIFNYDVINYLTLMMIDKNIHTHVIPRYSRPFYFKSQQYSDKDWPSPPNLNSSINLSLSELSELKSFIKKNY
jgi:diadenosine tetraphosphate (Ap4A) HIT family hydrolase